ncbi:MAG: squalene synthase HpnC [Rhodospirillales bacterium]|nr:squalene synthase HpnC [Rhodospirillales bacterium]
MDQAPSAIEMPSSKDAGYENFPVGSWLLPANLRPYVAIFYAFARAIDDIADSNELEADEKIRRLDGFEKAINDPKNGNEENSDFEKARRMRESLEQTNVSAQHCLDLISAFKQDAVKGRYANWDELIDYCLRSAAPVGRYLLDLHGGADDGYASSDALCNALQVLNHLQDTKADYLELDRVYLPLDWMEAEGAVPDQLAGASLNAGLRKVYTRALDQTDALLAHADQLPKMLKSRRLAMEAGAIIIIAHKLSGKLRRMDPLAGRVELSKFQYFQCCITGAFKVAFGR